MVVLLLDDGLPIRVVIVEVKLAADPRKRLSWPAYVTVSRAFHGCSAALLIVAPDLGILSQKDPERLERWLEKAAVAASVAAILDEPS